MDFYDVLQDALWRLVALLLSIAIPVLLHYARQWIKAQLNDKQQTLIDKIVSMAVSAVQQMKANGVIGDGAEALDYAVNIVQRELDRLGIRLDAKSIIDAIEANYNDNIAWVTRDLDAATLNALITSYVDSGLGDEVKKIVVALVERYFKQFGISVDPDTLEAMALSELAGLVK